MPTLYFDESGYTGPDLLNKDTPFYACSSLNITEAQAVALKKLHFPDKTSELKFADMKTGRNFYRARDLVEGLLKSNSLRVLVIDKRFALSAKMFEWLAEPSLSDVQDVYSDGFLPKTVNQFHRVALQQQADQLLKVHQAYQDAVKDPDGKHIQALVDALTQLKDRPGELAHTYLLPPLQSEGAALFEDFGITEGLNGILLSAAWQNLLRWGAVTEEGTPLDVVYDEHSVMEKELDLWNRMTGASFDMTANGRAMSLNHPVTTRLGKSSSEVALQIADVVAGFSAFAMQTRVKFTDRERPDRLPPGLIAWELLTISQFADNDPLVTVEAGHDEQFSGWTINR